MGRGRVNPGPSPHPFAYPRREADSDTSGWQLWLVVALAPFYVWMVFAFFYESWGVLPCLVTVAPVVLGVPIAVGLRIKKQSRATLWLIVDLRFDGSRVNRRNPRRCSRAVARLRDHRLVLKTSG